MSSLSESTDHVLTGPLEQARGVIGRYPDLDERYIFEFGSVKNRLIHMVGVTRPLRVEFFVGDELVTDTVLQPWTGHARARCDRVIEQMPKSGE